ncbi:hypothetical protein Daesc_009418 [Daldinia eschscholtzii]|uniref:Uncharacterized protein n=1 Tax=Daldinia eschscholtzii TaxID=292717 RepID=A0AAX6MA43_9PEZI
MSPGDFSEHKSDTQGKTNNISEISATRPWFFTRWMGWFWRTFRYLIGDNLDDNLSNPPKVNSGTESQPEGIKIYIPAGVVTSRQLKVILESSLPGMYSVQKRPIHCHGKEIAKTGPYRRLSVATIFSKRSNTRKPRT